MTYQAPLQDTRFALKELANLDAILALPGFDDLTPDLVDAILEENARFHAQVIAPLNRAGDTAPPVWRDGVVTATPGFGEAYAAYAAGGWQGLGHGADWGGQGLPRLVSAAAGETMQAANLAFSLCPLLTDGVIEALLMAGSDEQKRTYVPKLMAGQWTGTMNLTEPQAGSDLSLITTRAVRQDDGRYPGAYRIHGQKIFITWGEHDLTDNIVHLVLARTPDAPPGIKGLSLFVVPKFLPDAEGNPGARNDVWCASIEHKLGIHASPTAVLLYGTGKGDVGEDEGREGAIGFLVGEEHRGLAYMFIMMNAARYAVGQQGVAVAERATQQALAYARERVQSPAVDSIDGKPVAIVAHPDVQRMLLTMRALTEAGRALALVAAAANDCAARHPDDAVRAQQKATYEYLVPVFKGFATESAVEVATLGVQVHGGMGYIEETGAAQHLRDARILSIYEGTTAIQANDLIGRKTLRDGGAVARACVAQMRKTLAELAGQVAADAGLAAGLTADLAADLTLLHSQFAQAIDAYDAATTFVLAHAQSDIRAVFAGSVPYLMLAGIVHGGWHMARAALACLRCMDAGENDTFYRQKLATAVFYGAHLLPRAVALRAAVQAGATAARCGAALAG